MCSQNQSSEMNEKRNNQAVEKTKGSELFFSVLSINRSDPFFAPFSLFARSPFSLNRRPADVEDAGQIRINHCLLFFELHILGGAVAQDASVVDDDIQATEARDFQIDHRFYSFGVANVRFDHRVVATPSGHGFLRALQVNARRVRQIIDDDISPRFT